jgi:Ca2+-binding RTX toxin-like protein
VGLALRTSPSGDAYIDGLLGAEYWSGVTTFSFPTLASQWTGYSTVSGADQLKHNPRPLTTEQQWAARAVMAHVESFTNLELREASSSPADGDIRFGRTADPSIETAAAYLPGNHPVDGDVWFSSRPGDYLAPMHGNYDYFTFLHEIGHALGLEHPHEGGPFGRTPSDRDHVSWTAMSYRSYQNAEEGYVNGEDDFPQTFMLSDIAALQHLYGADYSTNSGDTVYGWSPTTGVMSINGASALTPSANNIFMTLWDGGGIDTYDLSAYTSNLEVNLAPGNWSKFSIGQTADLSIGRKAPGNVANAYLHKGNTASLIENAIGGSADDRIVGNQAANRLEGRGGADSLDGGEGADTLVGGEGSDTYVIDHAGDAVIELAGQGTADKVLSTVSWTLPEGVDVEALELSGVSAAPRTLTGNSLQNSLHGSAGSDILNGGAGLDAFYGGGGDDIYVVDTAGETIVDTGGNDTVRASVSWTLGFDLENLELAGAAANGIGNTLGNNITGTDGANLLDGRAGADRLAGKGGDDVYLVDHIADTVIEELNGGADEVRTGLAEYRLGANLERLTGTNVDAAASQRLLGNALDNVITGSAWADYIEGGEGNDVLSDIGGGGTMDGQGGDDRISLLREGGGNNEGHILSGGMGNDEIAVSLVRDAQLTISGGDGADIVTLAALTAGTAVSVALGAGRDILKLATSPFLYQLAAVTIEDFAAGDAGDLLDFSAFVTARFANIDPNADLYQSGHLKLLQDGANAKLLVDLDGAGDGFVTFVTFKNLEAASLGATNLTAAPKKAAATPGDDRLVGTSGNDVFRMEAGGDDRVEGLGGDDTFHFGNAFNAADFVDGGAGADSLILQGDYRQGLELSTIANIETLTLLAAGDTRFGTAVLVAGYVLSLADTAVAAGGHLRVGGGDLGASEALIFDGSRETDGRLSVTGGAGADDLAGTRNSDLLQGGAGNDRLDGGGGADTMVGGIGDDTYVVDDAADEITEFTAQGDDRVLTGLASYVLAREVERLTGTSASGQVLTGNSNGNDIAGGAGNDRIDGGWGNDTMRGGLGNDVYIVDHAGDLVVEETGGGTDEVRTAFHTYTLAANVENLTGTNANAAAAQRLVGNALDNAILGGAHEDQIEGREGNDVLTDAGGNGSMLGGAGNDRLTLSVAAGAGTETQMLAGEAGDDELRISLQRDAALTLNGGAGADLIEISALTAASRASVWLDEGRDTLRLGNAPALYQLGAVTVFDFAVGPEGDRIDITTFLAARLTGRDPASNPFETKHLVLVQSGADTLLQVDFDGGGDQLQTLLTFRNVEVATLVTANLGYAPLPAKPTAGNDRLTGTAEGEIFLMQAGGDDDVRAMGGNDVLYFGGAFTAADFAQGGDGSDELVLQGDYGAGVNLVGAQGIERVTLLSADSTRFGPAVPLARYTLLSIDAVVGAFQTLVVDGSGLGASETLSFDGSPETSGRFQITGGAGADTLRTGAGDDRIDGGAGADAMNGGTGDDLYFVDNAGDTIADASGLDEVRTTLASFSLLSRPIENLTGLSATGQTLTGGGGVNVITGGAGNDVIDGGEGADHLHGGAGDDLYLNVEQVDTIVELAGGGIDEIRSSANTVSIQSLAHVENVTATGFAQSLFGNGGANRLIGTSGADSLNGREGADTMIGGAGDDRYNVDDAGDVVVEEAGGGTDEIFTNLAAYSLAGLAHVEFLTGLSAAGQVLTGHDGANALRGNDGNDRLDGAGGADYLSGGAGNDVYIVDHDGDVVTEFAGAGTDEVRTALAAYALGSEVENLTGTSATGQTLTGNGLDNVLFGGMGDDTLLGGGGNDILIGFGGSDVLRGQAGDDVYIIDAGDTVVELAGDGIDEVRTQAEIFVLTGAIENLRANSDIGHDFRGNELNNVIVGAAGNDVFRAQDGGGDLLFGLGGVDSFYMGGAFDNGDLIDGGDNRDSLILQGNYAAGLTLTWDITGGSSIANIEGISLLSGSVTHFGQSGTNLYSYNLTLVDGNIAAGALMKINGFNLQAGENFTLNASAETDAPLQVFAGFGIDNLTGGQQGDAFIFGHDGRLGAGDRVDGGGGYDVVYLRGDYTLDFNAAGFETAFTNVESLAILTSANSEFAGGGDGDFDYTITWADALLAAGATFTVNASRLQAHETFVFDGSKETDGVLRVFGGASADTLTGGGSSTQLHGGGGADVLNGGTGTDLFRYSNIGDSNAAATDTVHNFVAGTDKIDVGRVDAKASTSDLNEAFIFIGANAFSAAGPNAPGQLRTYNVSGDLWRVEGDVNGDGIADLVIDVHVEAGQPLTAGDFIV